MQQEGETADVLIARARPWLEAHTTLPEGVRIAFEDVVRFDPDTNVASFDGVRSMLLEGEPIITEADVLHADVVLDSGPPDRYSVRVTLKPNAGERFRVATRNAIQRRIAIVVDGRIDSAPVVKAEIGGGRLTITMGVGEPVRQLADARRLADALSGR